MVWPEEAFEVTQKELEELGYCAVTCRIDAGGRPMNSSARAEAMYKRISALSDGTITVFLGDDSANGAGLGRLLALLGEADSRVLAWRETL
jgi:hypothetical protein